MGLYNGEVKIELHNVKYNMIVNVGSIMEFEAITGKDFMAIAAKAINGYWNTRSMGTSLERAEAMTQAVSMSDAAHFFYICAKQDNSQVELGEFEEACLLEGIYEDPADEDAGRSYPLKFTRLAQLAALGIPESIKKKTESV